ncbi:hypothetical protein A2331_06765 [Candidatus Falkowbacteria bacterium RIFOXYB2_FULL_34_18]|uniref:SAICAR synthetase/ADE2 N-terminal domain-containing protein n=1 Tax=Candidatus Falkowbacteria bacterium RIFOXYD2_FULL_34_120 TaxID=1798007 RepID=A0A1F5TRW1_9BACT|nr:MAG: hypothetical protein A2331_06765 [Candidatus Falkowbacteria bacterium RIFOXYB2_FULL_34_18]OGF29977.1 MAG: hypothetical protein A2500_03915 [Candidatus Falkowbacteria bacterium RIFOXYC12_FULL_34_55]OGF37166.1 MAG: hypothetical protein A2466_02605 [Candidatus Falkowbacteria bacterium RIFOXYC2_FULL_34_220]OGF39513.1 MAG: hypothetical protein A2515_04280 [Candidatus Falkowbacteria bacterium RIFOXYD12_FULL_34_57]OGF41504.1 MAG: hypothetical protein A2531_02320 [Candidatus Falkowbacteria bact
MIDINKLTEEEFKALPSVAEGESKEVRYAGKGLVVIRFKPTIYSFTANRCGVVPGSDILRLRASKVFLELFRQKGIKHAYREINDKWVLSDLILQPGTELNPHPFRPDDMNKEEIAKLAVAAPIEIVVKNMHTGTSKHRYYGMIGHPIRKSHNFYPGFTFEGDGAYPETVVRFDWRNPLKDNNGNRLADEILPDELADWYINTKKARGTALKVGDVVAEFLNEYDIVFYDLCLFITEDGETVFGEISQDCGRYRHFDLGSLDKDAWRAGGSSEIVLKKWDLLLKYITDKGGE